MIPVWICFECKKKYWSGDEGILEEITQEKYEEIMDEERLVFESRLI
jgi:uncharacterized protein with PIN domain